LGRFLLLTGHLKYAMNWRERSLHLYDSAQYPEPIPHSQTIFPFLEIAGIKIVSAKVRNVTKTEGRNLAL
jgi:hypothetical protein